MLMPSTQRAPDGSDAFRGFAFTDCSGFPEPERDYAECPALGREAGYQPPILITESMQLAFRVLSLILSQYDDFLVLMASSR